MSNKCSICGKSKMSGNQVSHSNRHTRTTWTPNIQSVRAVVDGINKRIKVCTSCIRSNKVTKVVKRTYKKAA